MAKLTFRAKLKDSNPSLIRYFEIDDRRKIDDLIRTVMILFGIENPENSCLNQGTNPLPGGDFIENRLSPKVYDNSVAGYTISCDVDLQSPSYYGYELENIKAGMIFDLELETALSEWEQEKAKDGEHPLKDSAGPKLIGWRGPNLIPYGRNLAQINAMMHDMIEGNTTYIRGKGTFRLADFLPKEEKVNQALYKRIVLGITQVKLNRDRALPLSDILGCRTASALSDIIYYQDLPLSFSGNKNSLLNRLMHHYDNDGFWSQLITDMDPDEYDALLDLLCNDIQPDEPYIFGVMNCYGLLAYVQKRLVVPTEFLIWFENFLNSKDAITLKD